MILQQGCKPVDTVKGSPTAFTSYNFVPTDANSLIPWLNNLSSSTSSSSNFPHHYMHAGSLSAPVTPPSSSPIGTPRLNPDSFTHLGGPQHPLLPMSTPPSPGHQMWYPGTHANQSGTTSPTFSLVSSNPFGFRVEDLTRSGSLGCTPARSGTCSPALAGADVVPMAQVVPNEFVFGSSTVNLVKPWEGETIHEECGDELELTLGSSKCR